jgi:hypothetical protein
MNTHKGTGDYNCFRSVSVVLVHMRFSKGFICYKSAVSNGLKEFKGFGGETQKVGNFSVPYLFSCLIELAASIFTCIVGDFPS